ncbi:glycoside hydrolase family 32 protein [Clostridium sp. DJ247]|uniref:GH32 C-terminal domain-containing protein n=1 Tax=Clostridium sp. DJ247 TaxID=2726188 RepID=UPI0016296732|nr:glycoside hydrolase family 32 protein [Clostridium sp. DJ247]MBC2580221.1 glycoside hydrolase family 32 protein [Clostridium sp. DJ247]
MNLKTKLMTALIATTLSTVLSAATVSAAPTYTETYRPQFHFSPGQHWMNDPNGMFYLDGEYHLFYQYYPDGITWGPMHWGHAVSPDMVNWTEYPIAMYPDDLGMIFSGSAVVDYKNTSGLGINGQPPIIAMYTSARSEDDPREADPAKRIDVQEQSIAYSNDKGRTWKKYEGNPVIPSPGIDEGFDFRDPKVAWYDEGNGNGHWYMTLVQHDEARIYTSPDLKNWTQSDAVFSATNLDIVEPNGDWECPDLFPLQLEDGTTKWVMVISINPGAKYGSGTVYMIGDFDGKDFTNVQTFEDGKDFQYLDNGSDNYAGVTWSNIPGSEKKKLFIGWMSNWKYATATPTDPAGTWRSAMTVPRELQLKTINGKIKLINNPVAQLDSIKAAGQSWTNQTITPGGANLLSGVNSKQYEINAEFRTDNTTTATEFGFKVRTGGSQYTKVYYDKTTSQLKIDRSNSGARPGSNAGEFDIIHNATATPVNNTIKMKILVDASSVELFGNDGIVSMTDVIFPDDASRGAELYTVGDNVTVNSLTYTPFNSATPKQAPTYVQGAKELKNHDFETGDLTGWTILSGNAFTHSDVTDFTTAQGGNEQTFGQNGNYHLWGFKNGGDAQTGVIKSENFVLDSGNMDFLLSGGNDINNLYVALCRASDGAELIKATGANSETYARTIWDSSSLAQYVGTECYIKVVDNSTGSFGHINLDDVNVPIKSTEGIANHDFESEDLTGWRSVSGTAFKSSNVTAKTDWWSGTYGQNGSKFLSGYKEGQDVLTGELRSENFVLTGNGKIDLLVGGGNDINNEYVALCRASDNTELFKATGTNNETMQRVFWDASTYLGTECYIKIVDNNTGSWGHINVDDVNVGRFDSNLTGTWSTVSGTWTNATGGKIGTNAGGDSFILNSQTGSDFVLEGDIKPVGGVAGGLIFRANSDATQFYCANVDTSGVVKLWRSDGTVLGTYNTPISANNTYKLKVVANGSNIKVYLNDGGTPAINVNDATYTSGQFGMNVFNGASVFQNIKVSTLNTNLKGFYSPSGTWSDVEGGKQGVISNADGFLMSTTVGTDFTYEGDLKVTGTTEAAGLVFRADADATKFYCANIDASGVVKLWGPGLTPVTANVAIQPNTVYHLKVVTSGSNIQVFFNGETTPVININDSNYTSGRFGINVWNGTGVFQNLTKN